jgi:hypothetical protein
VLADQHSTDDLFAGRAVCGEAGQQLQGLLQAAGLTRGNLILRTVPVDTSDLTAARRRSIVDNQQVQAVHREVLRRVAAGNPAVAAVLTLGPDAHRLAPAVVPAGVPVVQLAGHGASGWHSSWQDALTDLAGRSYPRDIDQPTFAMPATRSQLPRIDLPYGVPRWVGTSGDRAVRPTDLTTGKPSPDYLKVFVPGWVARLEPAPLSPAEQQAADRLS